jgi:hypothetical protein
MKSIIILIVSTLWITSCMDSGEMKIQNKVHNTKLENISFGDVSIYSSLLPGETSTAVKVTDEKESFPKINQLEFYMVSNGNRVYLKTKKNYKLDAGGTLLITISDSTEVINPLIN